MHHADLGAAIAAAQQLAVSGAVAEAVASYRSLLQDQPGHPLQHVLHFNLGVLLAGLNDLAGASEAYAAAIRHAPEFLPAHVNLGVVCQRLGAAGTALERWSFALQRLAAITPDAVASKVTALKLTAQLLEGQRLLGPAEAALQEIIAFGAPGQDVVQHWLALRQRQCRWPLLAPVGALDRAALLRQAAPLTLANYADDPILQLAGAHRQFRTDAGPPAAVVGEHAHRARPANARLRVGYLSSDLREHAIGTLMAELFGLHERATVEVFVYYTGIAAEDANKARIRAAAEHWHDLTPLDDDAALARILADRIDILVDVNGHTRGARAALLARRPAPVIVNWLGYPGSMGSPCHHYIIADPVIIPPENEHWYSEQVLRLPCYQPNDRQRPAAARLTTRAECGLPEQAMVYCSFNGAQKVTPFVFVRWMEILRQVPGSVLWLLKGSEEAEAALRAAASACDVAPERLVFAPVLPNAEHVARYALADLFLDTLPYGAHTTASDALWQGLPVLTQQGRSFAARVCASLVRAAGLPELVCATAEEYLAQAIALGREPARLLPLRERLLAGRQTCLLFDTPLLVRELEGLYRAMWAAWQAGRLPQPRLTNLDACLEVGVALDHDAEEFSGIPDYEARYRAGLARLHAAAPLPPDGWLWHAAA